MGEKYLKRWRRKDGKKKGERQGGKEREMGWEGEKGELKDRWRDGKREIEMVTETGTKMKRQRGREAEQDGRVKSLPFIPLQLTH